jgi:hypothetical protein
MTTFIVVVAITAFSRFVVNVLTPGKGEDFVWGFIALHVALCWAAGFWIWAAAAALGELLMLKVREE